jgi:hypothetical protein
MSRLWLAPTASKCHFGPAPKALFWLGQERNFEMRDELDGRMWVANHHQFGLWVDGALARLRAGLSRLSRWDGTTGQLLAMIAALAITALSFNSAIA